MQSQIEIKLSRFLEEHAVFTEECHALYLLVEIRKILDHERSKKYPLLRFYADWSVHTEKDHISPQIETTMKRIHKDILGSVPGKDFNVPLEAFNYMVDLRKEMESFLTNHNLPTDLIIAARWMRFQELLVKLLSDQPIIKPCDGMKKFSFKETAQGGAVEIEYAKTPSEIETFRQDGVY